MLPVRLLMTADAVGGVWQYALDLAGALAPLGIETVLALLGPPPDDRQRVAACAVAGLRLVETGLPLDWLAADEAQVQSAAAAIAQLAEREAVDLVQLNQPALAATPMPRPAVAVVHSCVATWWAAAGHGPLPERFAWQTALVRAGLARADAIVCPSRAFAERVRETYRLAASPHVVHNGPRVRPAGIDTPAAFALTAGRLWDEGKGVAVLDRAAARIGLRFEAAGATTSPAGDMIRLAHLHPLGHLDHDALASRLALRPVFASAARYEPFGLAVMEAAQAGCALVLADNPTFHELWDGVAAFVDPADDQGFAEAIAALVDDPRLRLARGELARRRAARFTPEAMAAGMAAFYRAMLVERAAA
ncbi:glycosyltransferase family 4 protein [Sphingomonas sp.]|uniref:glycosyltransferase family 4 protein n=1 Tax=Sphingomonas sp. TaxID=28214 RepID=UPI003B001591